MSLTQTTSLQLEAARNELKELQARSELAALAAIEAQAAAEQAKVRVTRMSRALAILRGEEPEPLPVNPPARIGEQVMAQARPEGPPAPGQSVAEIAAAAAAAGDPLALRKPGGGPDPDAPPPSNRPPKGPECKACGSFGTLQQVLKTTDKGSYMAIACTKCNTERLLG